MSLLGKADINNIKGHNQIGIVIYLLKALYNTWFGANIPYPLLMCDSVAEDHALLVDHGQLRPSDGAGVMAAVT